MFDSRYDERDVFMSREHFHELSDRLSGPDYLVLPKVFLHGQLLGVSGFMHFCKPSDVFLTKICFKKKYYDQFYVQDAAMIEHLNESGELRKLLKPFQVL